MSFELEEETPVQQQLDQINTPTAPMNSVGIEKVEYATGGIITYNDGGITTVLTPEGDFPEPVAVAESEVPITELTIPERIQRFAKWWVAFTGAVGSAAATLTMADGPLTWEDGINTGIAFLTALGVLGVRNGKKK